MPNLVFESPQSGGNCIFDDPYRVIVASTDCVFESPKLGDSCIFDEPGRIIIIDLLCIFDNPRHLNGGCIFDNETGRQVIHPTGGISIHKEDEEDILLIINSFLLMVNR